jgi:predicted Zn-dependent protease
MRFSFCFLNRYAVLLGLATALVVLPACKKDEDKGPDLTPADDVRLGAVLRAEILANPQAYPILNRQQFATAYAYVDNMLLAIRNGNQLAHKSDFNWEVNLIDNNQQVNAFAAPGGPLYIHTATLKYMQSGSEMAGFLAHLMAHADRRLVTHELKRIFGVEALLGVAMGENPTLRQNIAAGLVSLRFTPEAQAEADLHSLLYLCPTAYRADGGADFFAKLIAANAQGNTPAYLVTHPSPENRIAAWRAEATNRGCAGAPANDTTAFRAFLQVLP